MSELEAYLDLKNKVEEARFTFLQKKYDFEGVSGIRYDSISSKGLKVSNRDYKLVKDICDIDKLRDEYESLLKEANDKRKTIEANINKIDNSDYRSFLRGYYLKSLGIKDISYILGYSRQHIYRIKKEAEIAYSSKR